MPATSRKASPTRSTAAKRKAALNAAATKSMVALMAEAYRLTLLRGVEDTLSNNGYRLMAGVDEAGRGCLAGPVVAAAVIMDSASSALIPGIDDSKRLSAEERDELASVIREQAAAVASVRVSAKVIDQINILEATRLAMRRALAQLSIQPDIALIDAVWPRTEMPVLPLIRGDSMSYAIACASIIAKTDRDRYMQSMAKRYPGYGFARNKGYGSKTHRQALAEMGPTPIHRLTFRSVLPRSA